MHLFSGGDIFNGVGVGDSYCGRDILCDGEDGAEAEGHSTPTGPC